MTAAPLPSSPRRVRVDLADRSYDVLIAPRLLASLGPRLRDLFPDASRSLVVLDSGVPEFLRGQAVGSLAAVGLSPATVSFTPTEHDKSIATFESLLVRAAEARLERSEPIIAIGGGIVGDLTGFAAASYRRGAPFIQCPTTLLAMVDAAVGGKTGLNIALRATPTSPAALRKNMAGAFWQPRLVLCDLEALDSLAPDEFAAGLAECVKHALIAADWNDPDLWHWTTANAQRIGARDPHTLPELVERNVALKARVVASDEREEGPASADPRGGRMALNAGHTVAHALEAWFDHARAADSSSKPLPIKHGQAVALGLIAEALAALASPPPLNPAAPAPAPSSSLVDAIRAALAALNLPTHLKHFNAAPRADELLALMLDDKKTLTSRVRIVAPIAPGHARVFTPSRDALRAGLAAIGAI